MLEDIEYVVLEEQEEVSRAERDWRRLWQRHCLRQKRVRGRSPEQSKSPGEEDLIYVLPTRQLRQSTAVDISQSSLHHIKRGFSYYYGTSVGFRVVSVTFSCLLLLNYGGRIKS